MERQVRAFEAIVTRNVTREVGGFVAAESALRFPFVVVAMDYTNATCNAVADDEIRSKVCMTMGAPFQILDDCAILEKVAMQPENAALPTPPVTWASPPPL